MAKRVAIVGTGQTFHKSHRPDVNGQELINEAVQRAPLGELVDILDVGNTCAYLASPYARRLSGETLYIDGGVNIMA